MVRRDTKFFKDNSSTITYQKLICKFASSRGNYNPILPSKTGKKRIREDFRTGCEAFMRCTLYRKSKVGYFYLLVTLDFRHKHPILCSDALRHRKPLQEVKEKFINLFRAGHTAFTALTTHKMDLLRENDSDFYKKCGDGAYLPNRYRVYNWYKNEFKKTYGDSSDDDMLHRMTEQARQYNDEQGEKCVHVEKFQKEIIVVILTPLMKRHHKIPQAADIMGIDSGRGYDRHNTVIWHLTTKSFTVTVPLGLILTNSETIEALTKAIEIYKDLLPDDCFGGRGRELGPKIIMRDGSDTEGSAILSSWPSVIQLLCIFHVLQALWRWLFASENNIKLADRPHMLCIFRDIMYNTELDPSDSIKKMFKDKIVKKYKNYVEHIKKEYLPSIKLWALKYRTDLPLHGMLTNNATESAIKQSKEQVFQRIKAFNIPQTLDFILTRYEEMHKIKLCLVASNRSCEFHKRGYVHNPGKGPDASKITRVASNMAVFKVPSEFTQNKFYIVNLDLGICQCESGEWGATCKHQKVAAYVSKADSSNVIPVNNPKMRKEMYALATGDNTVSEKWFRQLKPDSLAQPETVSETDPVEDLGHEHVTQSVSDQVEVDETLTHDMDADTPSTHPDETQEVVDQQVDALIQSVADDLKQQHRNNPDMKGAIRKFAKTYQEVLRYPIAKQSALYTFGSEFATKRKLKGSGRMKNTTKGRGKKTSMPAGYKPRGASTQGEALPKYNLLPRKPAAVKPHNLGKLVKRNLSAAKRHSQAPVTMHIADI